MGKRRIFMAASCSMLWAALLGGVIYFAYAFPMVLDAWNARDREFSVADLACLSLSQFCVSYGMLLLPMLLVGFLVSAVWLVSAINHKPDGDS